MIQNVVWSSVRSDPFCNNNGLKLIVRLRDYPIFVFMAISPEGARRPPPRLEEARRMSKTREVSKSATMIGYFHSGK